MTQSKRKSRLPLSRLGLYFAFFGLALLLFLGFYFAQQKKKWNAVYEQIFYVRNLSETKTKKQGLNNLVRSLYRDTDPFYFSSQLESLTFLKKEKEALELLMRTPTFTGNETAEKRYHFITKGKNRLHFTESSVQSAEGVTESIESLSNPVEVDAQDLKEILFRIEGSRVGKPHLIITDFKLQRKEQIWGSEVYDLNLKLLKREFLK